MLALDDRLSVELVETRSTLGTGRKVWKVIGVSRSTRPAKPPQRHQLRSLQEAIGPEAVERFSAAVEEPS